MKIFSSFFLFLAVGVTPLCAQHYHGMSLCSCQQQQAYDASGVESDEQHAIENLEKSNNDLEGKIHDLQVVLISNNDLEHDILNLQDKLKEAEHDLQTNRHALLAAETKIEALEERLNWLEYEKARPLSHPASRNGAASKPTSKPKAPVNQANPADSPKDR